MSSRSVLLVLGPIITIIRSMSAQSVPDVIQGASAVKLCIEVANMEPSTSGSNIRGNIVAVNGFQTGGTWQASATDPPGNCCTHWLIDLKSANGSQIPIGTIAATGMLDTGGLQGDPHPVNLAIVGGTGAFVGITGQVAELQDAASGEKGRCSSFIVPAPRSLLMTLHVFSPNHPTVIQTPRGPAIGHYPNQELVTTARPAQPGEILTAMARGLGPTQPCLYPYNDRSECYDPGSGSQFRDPTDPFPTQPYYLATSPVRITLGGVEATVLFAGGYRNSFDFQINFRLPPSFAGVGCQQAGERPPCASELRITSAWVPSDPITLFIQ